MMMTPKEIEAKILAHIPSATVKVLDPQNDGVHLAAIVISESFEGMMRIKRHREVYAALGDAFDGPIHALALRTLTPAEAEKQMDE